MKQENAQFMVGFNFNIFPILYRLIQTNLNSAYHLLIVYDFSQQDIPKSG
jgi:hypothetical protein